MEFKDLKKILELVTDKEIAEFELQDGEFRLSTKLHGAREVAYVSSGPSAPAPSRVPQSSAQAPAVPEDAEAPKPSVKSPMVGTFYRASSPDAEPFVKVGDVITPDSTVCIIEAMKVMNEIKAEVKGRVTRVLIDNGEAVEFGQNLFEYEPI